MRIPSRRVARPAWCAASAALLAAGAAAVAEDAAAARAPAANAAGEQQGRDKLDPLPPAQQLLERARETLDDVMRRAANRNRAAEAAAEAAQRAQFLRQQAQQFENMLQPLLTAELAFVRRNCGSLSPEARREVLAASQQGIRDVALRVAKMQFEGAGAEAPVDIRRVIHEKVSAAVEPRAAAAEFAAYERESVQRRERREETARIQIVIKLDERLGLTEAQRQDVLADLRSRWQTPWIRELEDHGVMSNDQPLAPDFAEACIAPHLDPAQLRSWRQWSETAGAKRIPVNAIDWSEFNALQQHPQKVDAWWRP